MNPSTGPEGNVKYPAPAAAIEVPVAAATSMTVPTVRGIEDHGFDIVIQPNRAV